ncbi:MAG: hypothetical protein V4534_07910 [Myxococcota bacterium]
MNYRYIFVVFLFVFLPLNCFADVYTAAQIVIAATRQKIPLIINRPAVIGARDDRFYFEERPGLDVIWDQQEARQQSIILETYFERLALQRRQALLHDLSQIHQRHPGALDDDIVRYLDHLNTVLARMNAGLVYRKGACGHLASVSAAFAIVLEIAGRIEIIQLKDKLDGHAFVVLNRPLSSTLSSLSTWGEAVILDAWSMEGEANGVYDLTNLPLVLSQKKWTSWKSIEVSYPQGRAFHPEVVKLIRKFYWEMKVLLG